MLNSEKSIYAFVISEFVKWWVPVKSIDFFNRRTDNNRDYEWKTFHTEWDSWEMYMEMTFFGKILCSQLCLIKLNNLLLSLTHIYVNKGEDPKKVTRSYVKMLRLQSIGTLQIYSKANIFKIPYLIDNSYWQKNDDK